MPLSVTRVLGVDCGSERTGYGVIDSDGRTHTLVTAGTIQTKASTPLAERVLFIGRALREIIAQHQPACAAVEAVFHAVNAQSALKLAHVRGAVLMVIAEHGVAVHEYSPAEVKLSVSGFGRADKDQVQRMVQVLLRLPEALHGHDTSDACAVAICHAQAGPRIVNTITRRRA